MKFGQLIESIMRNIFLEKSYRNVVETSPRPFSGKLKLTISGSIVYSCIQFVFIVSQVGTDRSVMKVSFRPLSFTSY